MKKNIEQFIAGVPKAELHVHLEGTLERELAVKLASKNGSTLAQLSEEALDRLCNFSDLPTFLKAYYAFMEVLQTEDDFYALAYSYFTRVAKDNVVYVEAFFDPQAHTERGIPLATVMAGLKRAQAAAEINLSLKSKLILCILRDKSAESAMQIYEQALAFKDAIVGIGLDSDGYNNPPRKFVEVFKRAREDGFKITMHAEYEQVDIHQQIRECIELINVDRIDHGVNSADQKDLAQALVDQNIGLTVCPLSTFFINKSYTLKEIRILVNAGVKVTINSDDPAYFNGYINENLKVLALSNLFSYSEIVAIIKNAFDISWLTPEEKDAYIEVVETFSEQACWNKNLIKHSNAHH